MTTDAEFAAKVDKALETEFSESWLELEELFNEALNEELMDLIHNPLN